jgi:tRNA threonylcarbamoyladenosine biosynthesis protein TsaB
MILGLDTVTEWVYVAIRGEFGSWAKRVFTGPGNSASNVLLPSVDELLLDAGASRKDIKGAAACIGPGGFTSIRVGVATAEGLAINGLDVWGFSAFELRARALRLALTAKGRGGPENVSIVLDGQRREAFLQEWDIWAPKPLGSAIKIPLAQLQATIGPRFDNEPDGKYWWAPERFCAQAEPFIGSPPVALEDEGAATLEALTELCHICPGRPPENPLVPFYLRETDAEINFPDAAKHLTEAHRKGVAR